MREEAWKLYGRTAGIGLEEYYRDVETRALIQTFAKSANQPKNWSERQADFEELIRRVYIQTSCDLSVTPSKPYKSKITSSILNVLQSGDTIAMFNYDLLIEESFKTNELWSPRDGYGMAATNVTGDWCRKWLEARGGAKNLSKIRLFKLHGSLNWTLQPNQMIRLKERPYYVRTRNRQPLFEEIAILPPGWNKRINRNPYKDIWRQARLKLEHCKTLVILLTRIF